MTKDNIIIEELIKMGLQTEIKELKDLKKELVRGTEYSIEDLKEETIFSSLKKW